MIKYALTSVRNVLFLFPLIACSTLPGSRNVASTSSDQVRAATLKLTSGERIVILGINRPDQNVPTLDLARLETSSGAHFTGKDLATVDPRFLIVVNELGVQKIHSFELERFGHVEGIVYNQASKDSVKNYYYHIDHPEGIAALPAELLDVPRAEESLVTAGFVDLVLQLGEFIPAGGELAGLLKALSTESEDARRVEAGYLLDWCEASLERREIPELREAFSETELRQVASSLVLRYNMNGKYSAIFAGDKGKEKYFEKVEEKSLSVEAEQMKRLVKSADDQGLVVKPLNSEFAFVFYDDRDVRKDDHWNQYFKNAHLPEGPKGAEGEAKHLIPIGVFSLKNTRRPLPLVDFRISHQIGMVPRLLKVVDVALDLTFSYFPLDLVSISAQIGEYAIRMAVSKSNLTIFDDKVMSYGALEALLDAGYVKFNFGDVALSVLDKLAAQLGLDHERLERLRQDLQSRDPDVVNKGAEEILSLNVRGESESSALLGARSFADVVKDKNVVIQRLQNWLSDKEQLKSFESSEKNRD